MCWPAAKVGQQPTFGGGEGGAEAFPGSGGRAGGRMHAWDIDCRQAFLQSWGGGTELWQ
jgi:hypothetical protein